MKTVSSNTSGVNKITLLFSCNGRRGEVAIATYGIMRLYCISYKIIIILRFIHTTVSIIM